MPGYYILSSNWVFTTIGSGKLLFVLKSLFLDVCVCSRSNLSDAKCLHKEEMIVSIEICLHGGSSEYPQHMFWLRNKKKNSVMHPYL